MRCLIVDDEPLARARLRELVTRDARLELAGESADGYAATHDIQALAPDIVFLDIQMPGPGGMDIARALPDHTHVVFSTAHEQFAVAAFELQAVDYLLKPFSANRFTAAVDRLFEFAAVHAALRTERALNPSLPISTLAVRTRGTYRIIQVGDIIRVEAADDYAKVLVGTDAFLVSVRMAELAERLPQDRFVRVHRSHIVNLKQVDHVDRVEGGRAEITMADGTLVPVSRAGMSALRGLLG